MTPTIDASRRMGETGGAVSDAERLAFEAWMEGHCWSLGATWDGKGYIADNGWPDAGATYTRMLWAAWRDRAALENE